MFEELNIFDKMFANLLFPGIVFGTVVVQILIVEFGGKPISTAGLTATQWFSCIGIAFLSLPFGFLIRMIPVPKTATDKKPNPNFINSLEENRNYDYVFAE